MFNLFPTLLAYDPLKEFFEEQRGIWVWSKNTPVKNVEEWNERLKLANGEWDVAFWKLYEDYEDLICNISQPDTTKERVAELEKELAKKNKQITKLKSEIKKLKGK